MGAGSSKPADAHVFSADKPVSLSGQLVDSLQKSPESDSTREKTLEHQIQSRVTAELERLAKEEHDRFDSISESISNEPDTPPAPSLKEKIADTLNISTSSKPQQSHDSVSKEIAELKSKLEHRKKLEKADSAVLKAKDEVVRCLRVNDRRPLDCWEEVESFKREVARLESEHLLRATR